MKACSYLQGHQKLVQRRQYSLKRLANVRKAFDAEDVLRSTGLTIFCAGSLGRCECTDQSDLDVFVISSEKVSELRNIRILSKLDELNSRLAFPEFSQAMRYLRIYDFQDLVSHTGKPIDDSENTFTTRMLLVLESQYLVNPVEYNRIIRVVISNYFRDNSGKKNFRPLFIMNDVLRYWRTLCLNYEECREDTARPWRKKNINLKFSRMTTVFATILILMAKRPSSAEEFLPVMSMTPLERLAEGIDAIGDESLCNEFPKFLDRYAAFLRLKEVKKPEKLLKKTHIKQEIHDAAAACSDYIYRCLMHEKFSDLSRFLVL